MGSPSGPQGYRPLREFLVGKLKARRRHRLQRRRHPDHLGLAAGDRSGQRRAAGARRHRDLRAGLLSGLDQAVHAARRQVVGIPLDQDGMRMDALAAALDDLKRRGIRPKYIYTIPTVQNPTGTIMTGERRARAAAARRAIRRADLRGRLLRRPDLGRQAPARALRHEQDAAAWSTSARSRNRSRRRCVSATSSRRWDVLSRMLALKTDAGSGALEQMVLAEYCAPHFATHVPVLRARAARQARNPDGGAQRAVRHRGRVRRSQGRHLPLGEAARQRSTR